MSTLTCVRRRSSACWAVITAPRPTNPSRRFSWRLPNLAAVWRRVTSVKCAQVRTHDNISNLFRGNYYPLVSSIVSQTEGSEELRSRGLEIVGWYHSHPTFPALPSIRDLHTQVAIRVFNYFCIFFSNVLFLENKERIPTVVFQAGRPFHWNHCQSFLHFRNQVFHVSEIHY